MTTTLEEQLFDLDLSVPPDLSTRVLARASAPAPHRRRRPRGRTLVAGVGAGALFVGANVAAAEYVPAYREFMQVVPFGASSDDRAQQAAGIPRDSLVPVDQSLPGDEFNLTVVGTYADELRTVVLIRVELSPGATVDFPFPKSMMVSAEITDSAGISYRWINATGADDESGYTAALDFEPFAGAAAGGGEVTLFVTGLHFVFSNQQNSYPGHWEFPLSMEQREAPELPLPPVQLVSSDTEFTITSLRASGTKLAVEWQAKGGLVDEYASFREDNPHPWPNGPIGDANGRADHLFRMSLWPQFFDMNGGWVGGGRAGGSAEFIEGTAYFEQIVNLPVAGNYTIRFGQFSEDDAPDYSESSPGWPITIPDDPPAFVSP